MKKTTYVLLALFTVILSGCNKEEVNTKETINPDQAGIKEESDTPNKEAAPEASADFLNYENAAQGVKIQYPSNWTKEENFMGTMVVFRSAKEDEADLQENLNIIAQDISAQPMTLEAFKELSLSQLKNVLTDFKVVASNESKLDGNPAADLVYTGRQGVYNLKFRQVFSIKDNRAYILTFTSAEEKYDEINKIAEVMVKSFQMKK